MVLLRPFTVVERSDGRPAVQIDQDGKKQLFVSVILLSCDDQFNSKSG